MEQELTDRFGPLPGPARNLMYQLRLKVLARDAGVETIVVENGRLMLRPGEGNLPDRARLQQILGERAIVGRREVWLPLERGWQEQLVAVLQELARAGG